MRPKNAGKLFFVLLIFLAGCVPVGYDDPYLVRAGADAAIQATEAARSEAAQVATIEAGKLADVATATAAAWNFQASQTAAAATAVQAALDQQASQTAAAATAIVEQRIATETAKVEQQAAATATQIAEVERQRKENAQKISYYMGIAWRILLPVGLAFIFGMFLWLIWDNRSALRRFIEAKEMQARKIDRGPHKDPIITLRLADGRTLFIQPERLPGAAALATFAGVEVQGVGDTLDFARDTVRMAQIVDVVRAWPGGGGSGAPKRMFSDQPQEMAAAKAPVVLPDLATWSSMLAAWSGNSLPLGMGANGLLEALPDGTAPHLLMAGTSGSGKTWMGLRPVAACALAMGWQVVILDKSGQDFGVFEEHPNAHLVTVDLQQPETVVGYLASAYDEIVRRQRAMAGARASTYDRWGAPDAPRTLIVLDEFSNLADVLESRMREQLWRYARMAAAEGRKSGVLLALAMQDPTAQSIDLRIRRNCTPVAFKLQDAAASRVILMADGAERLKEQHFMTRLGGLVEGVACKPLDDDLLALWEQRPARAYEPPTWLAPKALPATSEPVSSGEARAQEIRQLAGQGLSLNEIQRQVFGFSGGSAYEAVRMALGSTTTQFAADTELGIGVGQ